MTDPASYFVTVHCFGLALSESMSLYGILLKLLAVLALGAICSLWLNNGIPNQTKRLDLEDELRGLIQIS